ncbi:putative ribonuclease H-like domain-containing protein [Tanacetum coccineum]
MESLSTPMVAAAKLPVLNYLKLAREDDIYKAEVMGSSSISQNTQNVAFVSSNITGNTNEAVKTAHGVSAANSKEMLLLYQIGREGLEGWLRDYCWTMRAKKIIKKKIRNLGVNRTDTIGFDKTKVECYNCHRRGYFARDCRALKHQDNRKRETTTRTMPVGETTSNALVSQCDGFGYDWSHQAEDGPTNFALMAIYSSGFSSSKSDIFGQKQVRRVSCVPPPILGNSCPPKIDLTFVRWMVSDSENENETESKSRQRKPSNSKVEFVKSNDACEIHREVIKKVENNKQANNPRKNNQSTRGRKHALSFMRPFEYPVTILNTIDHLGSGPNWLFDIDALTKSINYKPVIAGNLSNGSAEILFDSSSKNASNDEPQPSSDARKKDDDGGIDNQEGPENSAQDINTAGTSINTASTNFNIGSLNINTVSPTIPSAPLESTYADFFGDELELDLSNIATTYLVPTTPNTRIHKYYSLDHVLGRAQEGNLNIKRSKLDRSYARKASAIQITTSLEIGGFTLWQEGY